MYIHLFDRTDRLGSNIVNYLAQIFYAHHNHILIHFYKPKENYRYYHSFFVKLLFDYIDRYNQQLHNQGVQDDILFNIPTWEDFFLTISYTLHDIKTDYVSYFKQFIYDDIKNEFSTMTNIYNIPFDINKTILVHLRLDDTVGTPDYDGSFCSNYYKEKIKNNELCYHTYDVHSGHQCNFQSPLSKEKVENIIHKAKEQYTDYEVILLTSPSSDTSNYSYKTIKNYDESYDLYLLSMCKVVILSRSTFAISNLFFNNKDKIYIPLWGHSAILGFDTVYDNSDKSIYEYFY
jgi:hypothetical protein